MSSKVVSNEQFLHTEMHLEVNFPSGAITVLFSVSVSGEVLISYQASAKKCPLHQGYLSKPNSLPKKASRLGMGKRLGGYIARTADLSCPKRYSIPYDTLINKS